MFAMASKIILIDHYVIESPVPLIYSMLNVNANGIVKPFDNESTSVNIYVFHDVYV